MRRGENIYRRKDKRWEGRYKKGRKSNGKLLYGSVYGKTLTQVREKLYPLKVKYQLIQNVQGDATISLREWGYIWLHDVQPTVKPATYANYEHKLVRYVLSAIGEYSLNELDEAVGEELLASLLQRKLKPSTIQVIFRITNQCLANALRKQRINVNPFLSVKLPKVEKRKNQAITRQEQKSWRRQLYQKKRTEVCQPCWHCMPVFVLAKQRLWLGRILILTTTLSMYDPPFNEL